MSYHIFKKIVNKHYTIFLVQNHFAFATFQDKGCMHLHPKNHVHKCIDFSLYTNLPNLIFWVWDERPSQRFNLLLSHKVEPLGTSTHLLVFFIGLKVLTLSFIRLKFLIFIFHRTQSPLPLSFIGLKVLCHLCLTETIKVSFAFQRQSSLLACKDNHGHLPLFKDFNVFRPRLLNSPLPSRDNQVCCM